ncbi:DNA polymerase III subunit delta' [Megalodesulfovibrio gigas]|uniref:Putative DNA polymerase III subunit delta n=1 Tax=Megalodesulfovibrio gigas (strain ATCC 19364 / DSM 1382 / NCIMB 9332 / VKM B-1759) TaxID=1121448 RepID=T2G918_MEGG1|nr:putative DNA polymerase III subunit delta' [Megalodesulfovibrio gigas]AGW13070.1 putative DNA polymerase III subunit delta' [Megalodesulfovibrio gigas DSM 1382 = ATCC 19364]
MAAPRASSRSAASAKGQDAPFDELRLPAPELLMARARDPRQARLRTYLERLATDPPQVLLLEGGDAVSRLAMGLWWTALHHCTGPDTARAAVHTPPQPASLLPGLLPPAPTGPTVPAGSGAAERPCLDCSDCRQIFTGVHHALHVLDGAGDLIRIDQVREIIQKLPEKPRHGRLRCILLHEAHNCKAETANTLLKSLEDPRPGNSFLLLAPQRERLLPTLVSRSLVLSLAWPDPHQQPQHFKEDTTLQQAVETWTTRLDSLVADGRGWFGASLAKDALDKPTAQALVLELQRRLVQALLGEPQGCLGRLDPESLQRLHLVLDEAHASLEYNVTPALVLDWVATRIYLAAKRPQAMATS